MTSSWHICNQGDAVGSAWILNFQPVRDVTSRGDVRRTPVTLHFAHGPWRNRFGCSCKQGLACWLRPCVDHLPIIIYRKMVWTGAITTWAYSLQMSALGYISRFLRLYQHSHQISVWSDWLKDALFRSAYVCKRRTLKLYSLATPG